MLPPPIILKGTPFTLTVIYLHHSDVAVIRAALQEKVQQAPAFLHQAPVVLNIAALSATSATALTSSALPAAIDWPVLAQAITEVGLRIVGVSGCYHNQQKQAINAAGLPVLTEGKSSTVLAAKSMLANPKLVRRPVRSGQQIYANNSDLIVTGQISAGAEVIADGHLHLYGVTRGRVIAGAGGAVTSRIFCTNLQAELIAIAGQYWLSEQIPKQFWQRSVTIGLQEEQLHIELLD